MTDLFLAECNLPESPVSQGHFHEVIPGTPAAGLKISVSNDGEHRSKETTTLISYDSACMSCNISSGCALKVNHCYYYYTYLKIQDSITETLPFETNGLSDRHFKFPWTKTSASRACSIKVSRAFICIREA